MWDTGGEGFEGDRDLFFFLEKNCCFPEEGKTHTLGKGSLGSYPHCQILSQIVCRVQCLMATSSSHRTLLTLFDSAL